MTDFERRVTEALESGATDAPDASGLVVAARRRARLRRRVRGGLVAGLVVVAVAVPVGVSALGGDSPGDSGTVATDPTPEQSGPVVPDGWQVEVGATGRQITDNWDDVREYNRISIWGHQPPAIFAQMQGLTAPAAAPAPETV